MRLHKYHLGFHAPGALVQLGQWKMTAGRNTLLPGEWVRVVSNYATGTGVVVVKDEHGAIRELDGHTALGHGSDGKHR